MKAIDLWAFAQWVSSWERRRELDIEAEWFAHQQKILMENGYADSSCSANSVSHLLRAALGQQEQPAAD